MNILWYIHRSLLLHKWPVLHIDYCVIQKYISVKYINDRIHKWPVIYKWLVLHKYCFVIQTWMNGNTWMTGNIRLWICITKWRVHKSMTCDPTKIITNLNIIPRLKLILLSLYKVVHLADPQPCFDGGQYKQIDL